MVRKVNDGLILKDILSRAQTAFTNCSNINQAYLLKAFIDFAATVYNNEIDLLLQQVAGINFELESYLLARLWENIAGNKENPSARLKIVDKINTLIKLLEKTDDGESFVRGLRVMAKPQLL
jgi:hypothetical protein